jgi:hypothetical protein
LGYNNFKFIEIRVIMFLKRLATIGVILTGAIYLTGCMPQVYINQAIKSHNLVKNQISLGDGKEKVVAILTQAQSELPSDYAKASESYLKGDTVVEIYYARSLLQADGLTTDDEFTPYIFNNGKLVGIGWTSLGGSKSQGQARSSTYVNTTVVVP